MQAGIITIGDEILIGQVVDTNSAFIADQLANIGIQIHEIRSVKDTSQEIITAIEQLLPKTHLIIITGGLGPTNDDITKITLAKYFQSKLVRNPEVLEHVQNRLGNLGVKTSEINKQQADLPEACEILFNENGTAPGMLFRKDEKLIVSMPGVPFEMKSLLTDKLIPILKEEFDLPKLIKKTFLIVGVGESTMAERLIDFEAELPKGAKLAYLPSPGILRLRLSMISEIAGSELSIEEDFLELEEKLKKLSGLDLIGYETESLEGIIGVLLRDEQLTISTAESCTGGNIARKIASIAGSSEYFIGSVVAYNNSVKEQILNVNKSDLQKYGAVSESVVKQMAEGVRLIMKTDYGIATSGIAGPSGGTEEKPVGTVWIALSSKEKTIAKKYSLGDHRGRNITKATIVALNMLRKELLSLKST